MKSNKKDSQTVQYPKEGFKEEFAKWLLAGIQEFPGGTLATSIFGTFFRPKIEARREEFFNMTFEVVQSVLKTSNKDKINRLRNFLLNGVLEHNLKEDQKLQVLRILDWLSDVHIIILNQLYNKQALNTIKDKQGNIYKGVYDSSNGTTTKSPDSEVSINISLLDEQNLSFFPHPAVLVLPQIEDFLNDESMITNLFGSSHRPHYSIEIANEIQVLVDNHLIKVQLTEDFKDENEQDNIETENKVYGIYLTYIAERLMRFIQDPLLFDQNKYEDEFE
jgi:hypothetical protein